MALEFSPEALKKFHDIVARYPKKDAAMLPVLYLAQEQFGYVSEDAIAYVARLMDQSPARVRGVVTFYTMLNTKPVGRHHIQICRTLSCALAGAENITAFYYVKPGHRAGRDDAGRQIHPFGSGMSRFLRHRADDAGQRRLLRRPDGRKVGEILESLK